MNCIVPHPTDAKTYYAASASGGVWKTIDGGTNWTALSDKWPFLMVSTIAIDNNSPDTLYVGSGDFDAAYGLGYEGLPWGKGVYKTTDGGGTWSNISDAAFAGSTVSRVLIDPDNSQIITVTTGREPTFRGEVWNSTDGGVTWAKVLGHIACWNDLAIG